MTPRERRKLFILSTLEKQGEFQVGGIELKSAKELEAEGKVALKDVPVANRTNMTLTYVRKAGTLSRFDTPNRRMAISKPDKSTGIPMGFLEEQVLVRGKWKKVE